VRHVTLWVARAVSPQAAISTKAHAYRSRIAGVLSGRRRRGGTVQRSERGADRRTGRALLPRKAAAAAPPADRWLFRSRGSRLCAARVVPLSLHVDYWTTSAGKIRTPKASFPHGKESSRSSSARRCVHAPGAAPRPGFQAVGKQCFRRGGWPESMRRPPRRVLHWRYVLMGVQAMEVDAQAELRSFFS